MKQKTWVIWTILGLVIFGITATASGSFSNIVGTLLTITDGSGTTTINSTNINVESATITDGSNTVTINATNIKTESINTTKRSYFQFNMTMVDSAGVPWDCGVNTTGGFVCS